jgi:nucleolar complex protein 3
MDVFKQLLGAQALPLAERLRCLLTATELLRGQGEALTIDRRDFYVRLYGLLHQVGGTHTHNPRPSAAAAAASWYNPAGAGGLAQRAGSVDLACFVALEA